MIHMKYSALHGAYTFLKFYRPLKLKKAGLVVDIVRVNSFLASGDFCHLLIAIANNLDPDQDRHNVGPDLGPNCLTL